MQLRPYQQDAVNAVYDYLRHREGNPCIVLPTAAGKTPVLSTLCSDAVNVWEGRVLVLAHVKELLEQTAGTLAQIAPDLDIGVFSAGLNRRDTDHSVIVAGIQSVYKRACDLGEFDLILIDEVHSLPPDGEGRYRSFLKDAMRVNPNVRLIGLTATPYRMTTGVICGPDNLLNDICYEIGVRELIVQGYLCPLKSKAGKQKADTSGLHLRGGEFVAEEVEKLMDDDRLVSSACSEIIEHTTSRQSVLIFAAGVGHARHIQNILQQRSGCEVGLVAGDTPTAERAEILSRFKREAIKADLFGNVKPPLKYLVNVNVLTTGFDAPNIDCVVLLRPTNSPGLFYQCCGRGFRLHPSKTDCLVLDFGGNILRHGPVDALQIKDRDAGNGQKEPPAKECPECHSVIHAAYTVCPDCGFEFPPPQWQKHEDKASTAGVLSGQVEDTEYDVYDTRCSYYTKRNAEPGTPPTLRVEYELGFDRWQSEWICFEHSGYARAKAVAWWTARSAEPVPETVEQALALIDAGALAETKAITVRSISGEKFDRIINHTLGPKPPLLDGSDERDDGNLPEYQFIDDSDIPF
ncbi:MAG: DEAD/DEAH box helicase [Phycisphaerae bacterium]|nr:DEAD/DEAH box helicase [Phycisphaerae bacterium]